VKPPVTVYIIESEKDGRWYSGQSMHPDKRIHEHNRGYSTYTKKFTPWHLFASKKFITRTEALRCERRIKNLKSRARILEYIQKEKFVFTDVRGTESVI